MIDIKTLENNQFYLVTIPIIRSKYNKTKSAKFKGSIDFITNGAGIIYDWKINFTEVWIDLYYTPAWKIQKINKRKKLFDEIKLKQERRPSKKENKLIKLNEDQLRLVNGFFNNREKYISTIKNIIMYLSGSNPSGEAKKPNSAQMVIDSASSLKEYSNFCILIDDLRIKFPKNEKNKEYLFSDLLPFSQRIELKKFIELNDELNSFFKQMQVSKNPITWATYCSSIKKYGKEYNKTFWDVEGKCRKARTRYAKEIEKNITKLPFGFTTQNKQLKIYENCHIYECKWLKELVLKSVYKGNKKNEELYLSMISDPNNFIPLDPTTHKHFDKYHFSYDKNGNAIFFDKNGIEKEINDKYCHIESFFWKKERKKYFEYRNNYLWKINHSFKISKNN